MALARRRPAGERGVRALQRARGRADGRHRARAVRGRGLTDPHARAGRVRPAARSSRRRSTTICSIAPRPRESGACARRWCTRSASSARTARTRSTRSSARDDEPLTLPAERRPQPDPADTSGGVLDILAAFAARRAETDAALAGLDAKQMVRPSQWGPYEVPHQIDVRFRLHRFASHIVEHTVQCEKTIESLGVTLNDPRAVVRAIGATRGAHERRSSPRGDRRARRGAAREVRRHRGLVAPTRGGYASRAGEWRNGRHASFRSYPGDDSGQRDELESSVHLLTS